MIRVVLKQRVKALPTSMVLNLKVVARRYFSFVSSEWGVL